MGRAEMRAALFEVRELTRICHNKNASFDYECRPQLLAGGTDLAKAEA